MDFFQNSELCFTNGSKTKKTKNRVGHGYSTVDKVSYFPIDTVIPNYKGEHVTDP